jgi:hypothetical protein
VAEKAKTIRPSQQQPYLQSEKNGPSSFLYEFKKSIVVILTSA